MAQAALLAPRVGCGFARRDPRALLLAVSGFALVAVSLKTLTAASLALVLAVIAVVIAGVSRRELLRQLLALEALMIVLLMTLPFTAPGEALIGLGPLTATRAGVTLAVLIVLKAHAVALTVLGLLGGLQPGILGHALARLGMPAKLVNLLLLTLRQIVLLHEEYLRLRQAMRARAFVARTDRHSWVSYGNLIGMLLVRALARARRLEAAMRCRCFQGRFYRLETSHWRGTDSGFLLALAALLGGLALVDRLP